MRGARPGEKIGFWRGLSLFILFLFCSFHRRLEKLVRGCFYKRIPRIPPFKKGVHEILFWRSECIAFRSTFRFLRYPK